MTVYYTYVDSPLDALLLTSDGTSLTGLYMNEHRHGPPVGADWVHADDATPFGDARAQLADYFAGRRTTFDLPLAPTTGTPFQRVVWEQLRQIGFGETISYGELARRIGTPAASRAVGLANGRNPLSIVVPCHRVVGANGKLTGYAGGVEKKERLLALERLSRPESRPQHLSRP